MFNIQSGEELRVSFDIDAREYQGKWFNSLRAWKVERIDPNAAAAQMNATQGMPYTAPVAAPQASVSAETQPASEAAPFPPQQEGESEDDLPF